MDNIVKLKTIDQALTELKDIVLSLVENEYLLSIDEFYDVVYDRKLVSYLNQKYEIKNKELEIYDNTICSELLNRHAMADLADIPDNSFEYILELIDWYR